ncbi:hypothetical protein D9M72_262530 [compost metagenome]
MGPTVAVMAHSARAVAFFSLGYDDSRIDCDNGISGPATAPCRMRAASSVVRLGATPHSQDDSTNSRMAPTNRRTCPMRCVSQPVSGIATALAAANSVITQVPSSIDTPRLPAIVGIATLAIDESSTFMKVARATAKLPIRSLPPVSGAGTSEV